MERKKEFKQFYLGLGIIIFYFVASYGQDIPLQLFQIDYNNWSDTVLLLYSFFYEVIMIGIILYVYKNEVKTQLIEYKNHIGLYLKNYIKYWFLALGLMMLSNIIISPFTKDIAQNEATVRSLLYYYPVYTFLASVVLAPIIEELVFRFSIRKLTFHIDWLFIILSGLVFGSMHIIGNATCLADWLYLLPYSVPGCVFAYTLVKSDNIFVPISLHTIHNGILVTLQMLIMFL